MYRIGLFSQITKTTIKTLRYYDEVGLLSPCYVNLENGYRYYNSRQLVEFHRILALKQMGFSISELISMMSGKKKSDLLLKKRAQMMKELRALSDQISRIDHYMMEEEEGVNMNYQGVVKEVPECIVYSKRMIIKNYEEYFQVIPELGEKVLLANPTLECVAPPYCFIIYHEDEYKEKDIDVEFCEAVTDFGIETDGIIFKKMPALAVVSFMHKGPYRDLNQAYSYAFRWIEENGYELSDHPRESYMDGIWNQEDENEWLTELQVPIVKK